MESLWKRWLRNLKNKKQSSIVKKTRLWLNPLEDRNAPGDALNSLSLSVLGMLPESALNTFRTQTGEAYAQKREWFDGDFGETRTIEISTPPPEPNWSTYIDLMLENPGSFKLIDGTLDNMSFEEFLAANGGYTASLDDSDGGSGDQLSGQSDNGSGGSSNNGNGSSGGSDLNDYPDWWFSGSLDSGDGSAPTNLPDDSAPFDPNLPDLPVDLQTPTDLVYSDALLAQKQAEYASSLERPVSGITGLPGAEFQLDFWNHPALDNPPPNGSNGGGSEPSGNVPPLTDGQGPSSNDPNAPPTGSNPGDGSLLGDSGSGSSGSDGSDSPPPIGTPSITGLLPATSRIYANTIAGAGRFDLDYRFRGRDQQFAYSVDVSLGSALGSAEYEISTPNPNSFDGYQMVLTKTDLATNSIVTTFTIQRPLGRNFADSSGNGTAMLDLDADFRSLGLNTDDWSELNVTQTTRLDYLGLAQRTLPTGTEDDPQASDFVLAEPSESPTQSSPTGNNLLSPEQLDRLTRDPLPAPAGSAYLPIQFRRTNTVQWSRNLLHTGADGVRTFEITSTTDQTQDDSEAGLDWLSGTAVRMRPSNRSSQANNLNVSFTVQNGRVTSVTVQSHATISGTNTQSIRNETPQPGGFSRSDMLRTTIYTLGASQNLTYNWNEAAQAYLVSGAVSQNYSGNVSLSGGSYSSASLNGSTGSSQYRFSGTGTESSFSQMTYANSVVVSVVDRFNGNYSFNESSSATQSIVFDTTSNGSREWGSLASYSGRSGFLTQTTTRDLVWSTNPNGSWKIDSGSIVNTYDRTGQLSAGSSYRRNFISVSPGSVSAGMQSLDTSGNGNFTSFLSANTHYSGGALTQDLFQSRNNENVVQVIVDATKQSYGLAWQNNQRVAGNRSYSGGTIQRVQTNDMMQFDSASKTGSYSINDLTRGWTTSETIEDGQSRLRPTADNPNQNSDGQFVERGNATNHFESHLSESGRWSDVQQKWHPESIRDYSTNTTKGNFTSWTQNSGPNQPTSVGVVTGQFSDSHQQSTTLHFSNGVTVSGTSSEVASSSQSSTGIASISGTRVTQGINSETGQPIQYTDIGSAISNSADQESWQGSWQHTLGNVSLLGVNLTGPVWQTSGGYSGTTSSNSSSIGSWSRTSNMDPNAWSRTEVSKGNYAGTFGGSIHTFLGLIPVTTAWADGQSSGGSSAVSTRTRYWESYDTSSVVQEKMTENATFQSDGRTTWVNGVVLEDLIRSQKSQSSVITDLEERSIELGRVIVKRDSVGQVRYVPAPAEIRSKSRTIQSNRQEREGDRTSKQAQLVSQTKSSMTVQDADSVFRQSVNSEGESRHLQMESGLFVNGQEQPGLKLEITEQKSRYQSIAWSFKDEGITPDPYNWMFQRNETSELYEEKRNGTSGVLTRIVRLSEQNKQDTYRDGAIYSHQDSGFRFHLQTRQVPGGEVVELVREEQNWNESTDYISWLEQLRTSLSTIGSGGLSDWSNLFAGWADGLSFGVTALIRQTFNFDDVVDKASSAYAVGSTLGTVHSLLIGFGGGQLAAGYNTFSMGAYGANGLVNGINSFANGDIWTGLQGLGAGVTGFFFHSNICNWSSGLAQNGVIGLQLTAGALHGADAIGSFAHGDIWGGISSLAQGLFLTAQGSRACFVAGTPLRTGDGSKAIEQFKSYEEHGDDCDYVLSRDENDPNGPLELKRVLKKFIRVSPVLNLHVGGKIIGTTGEHPFYVLEKGWLPAGALRIGDLLQMPDGNWLAVESVADSGRVETVYNLEVEGYHTYFVGEVGWGWSVWAHNANAYGNNHKNNLERIGKFGLYEIYKNGVIWKIGKADMESIVKATGLPTRLHAQIRKLSIANPEDVINGKVVRDLGRMKVKDALEAERKALQDFYDRHGVVPELNRGSFQAS